MRARAALALAGALLFAGAAGCPRLPPPPPRPSVALLHVEQAGPGDLRARFLVHNRGAASLLLAALDWELAAGERALARGRVSADRLLAPGERAAVDVVIALPTSLNDEVAAAAPAGLRLRGIAHLEPDAPAAFDEPALLR